jgi:hypothetical protein
MNTILLPCLKRMEMQASMIRNTRKRCCRGIGTDSDVRKAPEYSLRYHYIHVHCKRRLRSTPERFHTLNCAKKLPECVELLLSTFNYTFCH